MGAASSVPAPATGTALLTPQQRRAGRRSRFAGLAATGRYALLRDPATGVPIHVLGVYPCSPVSEEEAADLIEAVRPTSLYVDVHAELLAALEGEVRARRTLADGWRVPEESPALQTYGGAGVVASLFLRNVLADNEMMALAGAESLGAYKAGLAAALAPAPAAQQPPPRLLAFPYSITYRFGETLMRPLDYCAIILGDAGVASQRLSFMVGNPHAWSLVSPGAPNKNVPEAEHVVALPPGGYFTRQDVAAHVSTFRSVLSKAGARATEASCDMDLDLTEREAEARALGEETAAVTFSVRAAQAQATSSAVAYVLQEAAGADAAAAGLGGAGAGAGAPAPPALPGAGGPAVVALVNIGGMGCLRRNFDYAKAPAEALPPFTTAESVGVSVVPGGVVLGLGWGLRALGRRFPRTAVGLGLVLGGSVGSAVYMAAHGDWARYGKAVRAALASPRTVSPLARINRA
jgi:hypothetical protein